MHATTRTTSLLLRCALATALVGSSLLVGCDRGRDTTGASPPASAASGAR